MTLQDNRLWFEENFLLSSSPQRVFFLIVREVRGLKKEGKKKPPIQG